MQWYLLLNAILIKKKLSKFEIVKKIFFLNFKYYFKGF